MKFIKIESRKIDFIQSANQIKLKKIDILFVRYLFSSNQFKLISTDFKMQTSLAVIDAAEQNVIIEDNTQNHITTAYMKIIMIDVYYLNFM